ncbi:DUF2252 family protein [Bdellovibrio svalbardensis]|uniref:DUF2252 family protein n=1 Tax=Bdellovibrio svalbardensis TaxID=2972972 RepID=A0ABT6DJQ9_9BACT|nr:DUF2252 family protein [Bdellovibrio svalbardensis]MDG0817102.1 DUF2252 family protein [Bdellovibrio svalbardensis]
MITFLTVAALFTPTFASANGPSCTTLFTESSAIKPLLTGAWRKSSADLFMGFRSNAPHYWNWLHAQSSPLFSVRGVVSGDPHILNFGDVQLKEGGRKYSLVDVDDSGVNAPLAGDFLRYYVGNRISPFKVDKQDLYQAYVDGLNGKKMDKPDYLKKVEDKSDGDLSARQEKYLAKVTANDRFSEGAELQPLSIAPAEIQNLYAQSSATFKALMKDYQVLDSGFKTKDSGGSQGLARFWFLLESNGERHVWEFKLENDPATSLYSAQPQAMSRFQKVSETYRPSAEVLGPYQFVTVGENVFLLRERLAHFIDLDPAKMTGKKDLENGQQMSLYLANKMGQWQSKQPASSDLAKILADKNSFEEFNNLAEKYIQVMKDEAQK